MEGMGLIHQNQVAPVYVVVSQGQGLHITPFANRAKREQIDFIRPDFPYTGPCGDFRRGAAGHGFILRYPEGKEGITGIGHEPWQ